jgi:hypothetical protein
MQLQTNSHEFSSGADAGIDRGAIYLLAAGSTLQSSKKRNGLFVHRMQG